MGLRAHQIACHEATAMRGRHIADISSFTTAYKAKHGYTYNKGLSRPQLSYVVPGG